MVAVELPPEITASFVAEARSYLPQIADSLRSLCVSPGGDRDALSEAYRFAHTIKSSAAMMGHIGLSQVAELLEGDLECIVLGEDATARHIDQLSRSVGRIGRLLDAVTGEAVDVEAIIADEVEDRLATQVDSTPVDEPVPAEIPDAPAGDAVAETADDFRAEVPLETETAPPDTSVGLVGTTPAEVRVDGGADAVVVEAAGDGAVEAAADAVVRDLIAGEPLEAEFEAEFEADPASPPAPVEPSTPYTAPVVLAPVTATEPAAMASPLPYVGPVSGGESAADAGEDTPSERDSRIAGDELTPLIDSLAETVLALGRDAAHGAPDLGAYRGAVASWLAEFEHQSRLAPLPAPAPVVPAHHEPAQRAREAREIEERREALLRAAIEAQLRLQIEEEVRGRLALEHPEPASPFVAISARARRASRPAPPRVQVPETDEDAEMREVFALEAAEHLKRIDADAAALRATPHDVERLRSLRRSVHTLKGAAAMMGFGAVAELAHSLEDRLDVATSDGGAPSDDALAVLLADLDTLEGLVNGSQSAPAHDDRAGNAEESASAADDVAAPRPAQDEQSVAVAVPVRLERLDQLLTLAGETSVSASRWPAILAHANTALAELRRTAARVETLLTALQSERHRRLEEDGRFPASGSGRSTQQSDFDALELDRYTPTDYVAHELAQISAETVAAERELAASIDSASDLAGVQRRQASELQERLLNVRLVPLDELSGRLQRAVHSVALRRRKEVELVFEGADVAVDRAVLDAVADALQHLVRNAVDHGIEAPATRRARGKPAAGTVCVTARQTQGEVVIEVADDGAGIDPARVRAAAHAAGIGAPDTDGRAALELIFRPGLTTAAAVDDVSGRGVGLDAVAEAMSRIQGAVEVASELGSGTIFNLRFPVTLAQARVVMAEVGGNPVALPAASVKHVARLSDAQIEETPDGKAALLNGHSFPLGSLAGTLGWPVDNAPHDPPLVFVEAGARRAAWAADHVGSHADVVVKSLGSHLRSPRGLAGASLMQDGRVALVLHLPDLLGQRSGGVDWQPRSRGPISERPREVRGSMRVLVVDDSPTIRKLLVRMLRDLGWQPREAKDGAEALEAIRVDRPDVVLADIEMPRLDGYGLLSALRAQPATADLPVLMLTSRTADRHRVRAMELGANGYLTKPYRPEEVAAALRELGAAAGSVN